MSDINTAVVALLRADTTVYGLVATRIYPSYAPHNYTPPVIVYTRLSASRVRSADGSTGMVATNIQLSCWAATKAESETLSSAVQSCLDDYSGTSDGIVIDVISMDNELDAPIVEPDNEEHNEFGKILEFTIWYRE
jgi:hypothetical protein